MTKTDKNNRDVLIKYLLSKKFKQNLDGIEVFNEPNSYFYKEPFIVLIFNDLIRIKDISNNRKYEFNNLQSDKIIIEFLKYIENVCELN